MPRGRRIEDLSTLQMALVGYQMERQKIDEKIRQIEAALKGKRGATPIAVAAEPKTAGVKRVLSPAARKRIAAAQKKRWAEHRKKMAAAGKQD
jgi:hypothetical protein